jgi:hypothetical protein
VTAPPGIHNPEEPLVSIHGEMNGLNSCRHNRNDIDILGQSAGQFTTSAFGQRWVAAGELLTLLVDNVGIDRVEVVDTVLANKTDEGVNVHHLEVLLCLHIGTEGSLVAMASLRLRPCLSYC